MPQTTSQEQVHAPQSETSPQPQAQPAGGITVSRRTIISVAAFCLFLSFFLPWVNLFGGKVSGLDIQRNFTSYQLVWLMPALALLTFVLNVAGAGTDLIRRIAGTVPFIILAYSLSKIGTDLLQVIGPGAWMALISGFALDVIPNAPKPQTKG